MYKYKIFLTVGIISFQLTNAHAQKIKTESENQENLSIIEHINTNTESSPLISPDNITVSGEEPSLTIDHNKIINNKENIENNIEKIPSSNIPDIDPNTLNPKKPLAKEIYDVSINNNYVINALTFIFKDNHLLIEKKYLIPLLNDLVNPKFYTINNKEYFYIPARFVNKINDDKLSIDVILAPEFFKAQTIELYKNKEVTASPISAMFVNYNLNANLNDVTNFAGTFSTGFMHKDNWLARSNFALDQNKNLVRGDINFIYELRFKNTN